MHSVSSQIHTHTKYIHSQIHINTHWYLSTNLVIISNCKSIIHFISLLTCQWGDLELRFTLFPQILLLWHWPTSIFGPATRTWSLTGFPFFFFAITANYVYRKTQQSWRQHYLGLNLGLCVSWWLFCPFTTHAPQKLLFIRNVGLLKGFGKARGEEEKENRKGKDEGNARAESGEMLSGIRDSVWAADLSASWTPGGLTWNHSNLSLAGGKTSKRR